MSAVDEYRESRQGARPLSTHPEGLWHTVERTVADAAIAELETENERLTNRLEAWKTAHRPTWCPESSECRPAWEREQTLKAELARYKFSSQVPRADEMDYQNLKAELVAERSLVVDTECAWRNSDRDGYLEWLAERGRP